MRSLILVRPWEGSRGWETTCWQLRNGCLLNKLGYFDWTSHQSPCAGYHHILWPMETLNNLSHYWTNHIQMPKKTAILFRGTAAYLLVYNDHQMKINRSSCPKCAGFRPILSHINKIWLKFHRLRARYNNRAYDNVVRIRSIIYVYVADSLQEKWASQLDTRTHNKTFHLCGNILQHNNHLPQLLGSIGQVAEPRLVWDHSQRWLTRLGDRMAYKADWSSSNNRSYHQINFTSTFLSIPCSLAPNLSFSLFWLQRL